MRDHADAAPALFVLRSAVCDFRAVPRRNAERASARANVAAAPATMFPVPFCDAI